MQKPLQMQRQHKKHKLLPQLLKQLKLRNKQLQKHQKPKQPHLLQQIKLLMLKLQQSLLVELF
jgi:hypothetical protein